MFVQKGTAPIRQNGGMFIGNNIIRDSKPTHVITGNQNSQSDQSVQQTVIMSNSRYENICLGPIGKLPESFTLFDLFFEQTIEAEKCRQCFHDWAIPHVRVGSMDNGANITRIETLHNFYRGDVCASSYKMEQYLYAILNPELSPVKDFGNPDGTSVTRTHVIVCMYTCDPRIINLDNAKIEYALRLNTPIRKCVSVASKEIVRNDIGEVDAINTYYNITGDYELESSIGEKWFGENNFVFNGVIYPVAQNFMPPEVD